MTVNVPVVDVLIRQQALLLLLVILLFLQILHSRLLALSRSRTLLFNRRLFGPSLHAQQLGCTVESASVGARGVSCASGVDLAQLSSAKVSSAKLSEGKVKWRGGIVAGDMR